MAEVFYFHVQEDRSIKYKLLEPIMQEDKDVATWRFRIPKVLNQIDMSTWSWWFVYVNAKGQEFSELLTLTDDIDEPASYSTADYDIDYGISKFPGSFSFALEAISTEQGGEISGEWHTKTYKHKVDGTLQGNQAEYAETESDIISALIQQIQQKYNALVGGATPLPVNLKSLMTDHDKVYLYTGSESGESTGYWYYYNGSNFVPGGLYGAGVQIDTTLTQSGQAADAKVTGDEIAAVKEDLSTNTGAIPINGWIEGKVIRNDGTTIGNVSSMTGRRYVEVSCNEGDKFTINALGLSAYRAWSFVDANGNILDKSLPAANLINTVITAPANAVKLYINDAFDGGVSYKNKTAFVRLEEIETDLSEVYPQIIRIKDLMTESGGIRSDTHISNTTATYRHTKPIFIKAGETIVFNLYGTKAYAILSVYNTTTISAETFLNGIAGLYYSSPKRGKWTATQDCYVVFTTYTTYLDDAYAFVYADMIDAEKASFDTVTNILEYLKNSKNLIEDIVVGKTVNASGEIVSRSSDAITNRIPTSQNDHIMVQAWRNTGTRWLSVNFYDDSDTFLGRVEFASQFDNNGYLEAPLITEYATASYAVIAMIYSDGDKLMVTQSLIPSTYEEGSVSESFSNKFVLSANHRGYYTFPENTVLAFAESKRRGFDFIENDVRWTSDGVAVLLHDADINRVARNADGTELSETVNIADITYAQALTYDFGIYKGVEFAGTKICTLEECIAFCRNAGIGILLEPKEAGHANEIVTMVKKYNMLDHVIFDAFDTNIVTQISALVPDADFMITRLAYYPDVLTVCENLKNANNKVYYAIQHNAESLTSEAINAMINVGVKLAVYTVDSISDMVALDPYVSFVTSNNLVAGDVIVANTMDNV